MNRRGFTLLETMVALSLTALVLVTLRGVVESTTAARDRVVTAADRVDRTRTALAQLTADVDATVAPEPTAAPRIEILPPATRAGLGPVLRVTTATPDVLARTEVVTYAIVATPRPHLVRRGPFGEQTVLDPVRHFAVRALDGTTSTWVDVWKEDRPPRALDVTLASDREEPLQALIAVPVGAWP